MSIWTDLLFHHGHIANPDLARSLAGPAPAPAPVEEVPAPPAPADGLQVGESRPMPCRPAFPARGIASLCAVALSAFR
jgi:hypothetical protein